MMTKAAVKEMRSINKYFGRLAAVKYVRQVLRGDSSNPVNDEFNRAKHLVEIWT